jgi:hypothetical protein
MATESDNVNSGALGTLVAVGTIAFFGIALVVTALVRAELREEVAKKDEGADRPYRDMVAEQTAKLAAPAAYVDRGRGLVSLPIDRAMELTVSGLIKDPNSATPPAPIGGSGGAAGADAGGSAGTGGAGGTAGAGGEAPAQPDGTAGAKPEDAQKEGEKKDAPKPVPATPKAPPGTQGIPQPAPVAPSPSPAAPSPAPNGQ